MENFDAIVIGSGAGGASLAYKLCTLGARVLLVEKGGAVSDLPRRTSLPSEYMYHLPAVGDGQISFYGGQSKFYGAALYRFRESDFQAVEHEAGVSPAWPIDYGELEPYYDEAEKLFKVHGSSDGDMSEPPRRNPYPHPPLPHAPIVAELIARLEQSGTAVAPIPRALDYGPGGKCILCAGCDAHYCRLNAKMDAEVAALAPALATGNLTLLGHTECLRILVDPPGRRVVGVTIQTASGHRDVFAPVVALCAGQPHSAVLLHRSRTDAHPDGLGNHSGSLGRYWAGHWVGMVFPFLSVRPLPAMHTKTFAINQFYEAGSGADYPLGVIQVAGQFPFWEIARPAIRPIARIIGQRSLMCFFMNEAVPSRESRVVLDDDGVVAQVLPEINHDTFNQLRATAVEVFRKAGYRSLARRRAPYFWHDVGTARMGADPATSVVDPNCQVHGIEGLYVADGSVPPSAGAVNTGLTIMALALRAGSHMAGRPAHMAA